MINRKDRQEYVGYTTHISLDYYKSPCGSTMPELHAHDHYELMLVLQGKLFVQCENRQYVLQAPFALLYPPLSMHNANADRNLPYERYIVYFTEAVADALVRIAGTAVFPTSNPSAPLYMYSLHDAPLDRLMWYVRRLFDGELPPDRMEETMLLTMILYTLKSMDSHETPAPVEKEMNYIREVMRYIASNDSRDFLLSEISKNFFVSPAKLRRDFQLVTGTTLKGFQRNLRIDRAKAMLDNGCSTTETMLACHFSSMSDFSRVFKKITGQTPNEYVRNRFPAGEK